MRIADYLEDVAGLLTAAERRTLRDLILRAQRAGMSTWAYAVHTGRAEDLRVTAMYRAATDMGFCIDVFRRRLGTRWVDLTVV